MKQKIQSKKHIPIEDSVHFILKKYCKDNGFVLKSFVEKLIIDNLKRNGYSLSTQESNKQ